MTEKQFDFTTLLVFIVILVLLWFIGYIVTAWVLLDMNCMQWCQGARAWFSAWFFASFIIAGILTSTIDY